MFYLTTHSTHFIYGYMASDIWLRTNLIVRKETRCRHIGYSYRLTARVLLYAPSHRQDNTYHGLCYISRRALAGTRNKQSVHYVIGSFLLHFSLGLMCTFRASCYNTRLSWAHTPVICLSRERERNVLFNDALNTFYLRLYGVRHMV